MSVQEKFQLQPEHSLLLVIDVQERLCAAMNAEELNRAQKNIGILLESARELAIPAVFTEQYPKGLGATLPELKAQAPAAATHEKLTFSCCGSQPFSEQLKQSGRTQIIVCGMETHVCVQQTVIDLLIGGFHVHLVKDAVLSRAPANRDTGIEAMTLAGAVPTGTETVVFQWLKVAGTETFKRISRLVK